MWLLLPVRLMIGIPLYLYSLKLSRDSKGANRITGRLQTTNVPAGSKALDHVVERATDRRRGVIEDLHLGMEICIETIFDGIHKVGACVLSPMESLSVTTGF